jgi:hypothetical protein
MLRRLIPRKLKYLVRFFEYTYYKVKYSKIRCHKNNGIYYVCWGSTYPQAVHVAPIQKIIGGTIVVTSKDGQRWLRKRKIESILIENLETETAWHFNPSKKAKKTWNFLNEKAKFIVATDVFYQADRLKAQTLFVTHGSGGLKSEIFWARKEPKETIDLYDFILGADKINNMYLAKLVKNKTKILPFDIARNTQLIFRNQLFNILYKILALKKIGSRKVIGKRVIAYMPTYYVDNTLNDTGIEMLNKINDKYTVIFWPHPQTDWTIIEQYKKLAKEKSNIIIGQELPKFRLEDVYSAASLIIVDPATSVVSDLMLSRKKVIFSYGKGDKSHESVLNNPFRGVSATSYAVNYQTTDYINEIIKKSLRQRKSKNAYDDFINQVFYNPTGNSAIEISKFIINKIEGN